MASILIVFGSTTGNTEYMAGEIEKTLQGGGAEVKTLNASGLKADGLCDGYDMVFFGCSTWGMDSIELQDDFIPLFDNLDKSNVKGRKTAVFGCGDAGYEYYCGAVDAIKEKLEALGATVVDTMKVDGDPQSVRADLARWAKKAAA
jgi:flavodoxin short chain